VRRVGAAASASLIHLLVRQPLGAPTSLLLPSHAVVGTVRRLWVLDLALEAAAE
jgi:hypothetical protein